MDLAVVDTDVFSYMLKGDSRGAPYEATLQEFRLCVSFMTVAELLRWALSRRWGPERRRLLEAALQDVVVLPYDRPTADAWASITVERARIGRPIACGDCWIAAAALRHSLPLATHNVSDYAGIGDLRIITQQ